MEPPVPFVVGTGRSGTTLLRLMLDAHPLLAMSPETSFLTDLLTYRKGLRPLFKIAALSRRIDSVVTYLSAHSRWRSSIDAETFVDIVATSRRFADAHLDRELLRREIATLKPYTTAEAIRSFYRLYASRFGKNRWGDKTPEYLLYMQPIQNLVPEARFVHIIRDGRDVAVSFKEMWFGPDSVGHAARWWKTRILEARRQRKGLPHYFEVRYEDLLTDTETVLGQICSFIDLPWNARMLDYYKRAGDRLDELQPVYTPSGHLVPKEQRLQIHRFTHHPPQQSRVGRWRTEMSETEQREFNRIAGGLLKDLGYV